MPRIWADTIDEHRQRVQNAVLEATAELIAEHGPMGVSMSAIAERAGIGRATLYKYFPDAESILVAWHERDFGEHLGRLRALVDAEDVVLDAIATFVTALRSDHLEHGASVIGSLAHNLVGSERSVEDAIRHEVVAVLTDLLARLAQSGEVRSDLEPVLLANWLLHAVHAPADLDDHAVAQLITGSLAPRS